MIKEAIRFIEDMVINPALNHEILADEIKRKVQFSHQRIIQFRKVGDLFDYLSRFNKDPADKTKNSVYNALTSQGLSSFEEALPLFKVKFASYIDERTRFDDFIIGEHYSSWDISNFAKIYNNQPGIFPIGSQKPFDAIFLKGNLESGKYANEWLEPENDLKYYFKSQSGSFDPSYALNDAVLSSKGCPIYVFLKSGSNYKYHGIFELVDDHLDRDGIARWFHLKRNLAHTYDTPISATALWDSFENQIKKIRQNPSQGRKPATPASSTQPERITVLSTQFKRDPWVVAKVLERAQGLCENCLQPAPFNRASNGEPFLEVHHKIMLSQGGEDTVDNAIAVCPNCHRKLHFG